MPVLIGGAAALLLGLILLIVWWGHFISVLAGIIPIVLLAGGALAVYLGYEENKDRQQIEREMNTMPASPPPAPTAPNQDDLNSFKQETEKYKSEVEELKQQLQEAKKED